MTELLPYAGIGSRETPDAVLDVMQHIGKYLAPHWLLRSGFADGADNAFARGADEVGGAMELFIPWPGFNGAPRDDPRFIVPDFSTPLLALARQHHPAWDRLTIGARKLHARNGCQLLGRDLNAPVKMVICWTPNGAGGGGTGQAIRIANSMGIPVFDLARDDHARALDCFIEDQMHVHQ